MIPLLLWTAAASAAALDLHAVVTAAMRERHVPGVVVAVVDGEETLLLEAYGLADVQRSAPMSVNSIIGLQSTSKLFTGLVALELASRGRVDLQADIRPALRTLDVGTFGGRAITLFDLLTHTAGFDERGVGVSARGAGKRPALDDYLRRDLPPRVRPAGSIASYSNHGFALAGLVLQNVAGRSLDVLAAEYIFGPLGLQDTTFAPLLPAAVAERRVTGYTWRGTFVPVPPIIHNDWPASGAASSARDMASLLKALLRPGIDRWRAALTPQFRQHPAMPGIGIGGMVEERRGDLVLLRHGGDWQDYFNLVALIPSHRIGVFVAGNNGEQDGLGPIVLDAILAARGLTGAARPAPAVAPHIASEISGTYRYTRHEQTGIAKIGLLTGQLPEVRIDQDSVLTINGVAAIPEDTLTFRRSDAELWAVRPPRDGASAFAFRERVPTAGYERIPWIRSARVQRALFVVMFVALVVRVIATAIGRRRWSLADAAIALHVLFIVGVAGVLALVDPWEFQYGTPTLVRLWLVLPWLALASTLAAALNRRAYGTCALSFAFLALVHEWNLWVFWR